MIRETNKGIVMEPENDIVHQVAALMADGSRIDRWLTMSDGSLILTTRNVDCKQIQVPWSDIGCDDDLADAAEWLNFALDRKSTRLNSSH